MYIKKNIYIYISIYSLNNLRSFGPCGFTRSTHVMVPFATSLSRAFRHVSLLKPTRINSLEHALYELYTLVVDNTIAPWLVKTFWPFGIKYRSSLDVQLIMVADSFLSGRQKPCLVFLCIECFECCHVNC